MLSIRTLGDWGRDAVRIRWTDNTHRLPAEARGLMEQAWERVRARAGVQLFDGPMCRMEEFRATAGRLELTLSRTSYRMFVGTNLHNATLADRFGRESLANPVGLSGALESAEGWLLLGQRNHWVAYYPDRVHPFAGAMEPREDLDVFEDLLRELREELALGPGEIESMRCVAIVEDHALRQPELIFLVKSRLGREELGRRMDRKEHHEIWPVAPTEAAAEAALDRTDLLTPVATAAVLLWGRERFSNGWFEAQLKRLGIEKPAGAP